MAPSHYDHANVVGAPTATQQPRHRSEKYCWLGYPKERHPVDHMASALAAGSMGDASLCACSNAQTIVGMQLLLQIEHAL